MKPSLVGSIIESRLMRRAPCSTLTLTVTESPGATGSVPVIAAVKPAGTSVSYSLEAQDNQGRVARYPDGAGGSYFYEKQCPSHAPEWLARALDDPKSLEAALEDVDIPAVKPAPGRQAGFTASSDRLKNAHCTASSNASRPIPAPLATSRNDTACAYQPV